MTLENTEKKTLTVDEAAKLAGIGRRQAYAAVHDGTFPSLKIGNRIVIPRKKFMALIEGDE